LNILSGYLTQGDRVKDSEMISLFSTITIYISKVVIIVGHVHMLKNRIRQGNKTIFSVHKRSHKSICFVTDVSFYVPDNLLNNVITDFLVFPDSI
jgi:hypothetical protein